MTATIRIDEQRNEGRPPTAPTTHALVALGRALKQRAYHFTTVTPATHERVNARAAGRCGDDLADIFGWSRPFTPAAAGPVLMELMRAAGALADQDDTYRSRLRASTLDGHVYLHSAFPTTAEDAVFFGPDTYRFVRALRAELRHLRGAVRRAADIGCGAGPGAITVALAYPEASVFAVDINPAALALTAANASLAQAPNVYAARSDLLGSIDGQLDLIISNPPYLLDGDKRAYRHGGGELGAGLSIAVVDEAVRRLAPGGALMLYTGVAIVNGADPFRAAVEPVLLAAGFTWTYEELDPDVFGEELDNPAYACADRIAAVWLVAHKPGAPDNRL